MGIKIVQKANSKPVKEETMYKKAVITILGIQGGFVSKEKEVKFTNFENKATYSFTPDTNGKKEYFNTLPLLIDRFRHTHTIVPLYTVDAKMFNEEVLKKGYPNLHLDFDLKYLIHDEQNFDEVFALIEETVNAFEEIIVDVSHGFRHLPILMIVDLIIQNFKDTQKIKHIYFAKEIVKHDKEAQGHYEIIDLKEYLDLANVAFVLSAFDKNYTVASHITSEKYEPLFKALNTFSNDIMALNLAHLFVHSSKTLLKRLREIHNPSIKHLAETLVTNIESLTAYEGKKRYQTYFDLACDLFEKNYMLLCLSLLYESIRMYVKSTIKAQHPDIVQKLEQHYKNDLYHLGDFFIKLKNNNRTHKKFAEEKNIYTKKEPPVTLEEFDTLKKAFPSALKERIFQKHPHTLIDKLADTRNRFAHANSDGKTMVDIKNEIHTLITTYEQTCQLSKSTIS